MFNTFDLDEPFGPDCVDGQLLGTLKHESVVGAYTYEFKVNSGTIIFSVSRGILQEVSYRFGSIFPWVRAKQGRALLEQYTADGQWKLVYQDRSGKMYHSEHERFYAAVGSGTKYINIGSMMFHEEKYRVVS